jgi:hypothetical protein
MVQILYKQVLNLEIWHDFFLGPLALTDPLLSRYDLSGVLTLVPTAECLQTLRNLRWCFRPHAYGGFLFAQVEPVVLEDGNNGYRTQVPVTQSEQLTFWLQIYDRTFANFTNLPLESDRNLIYYFSNLTNNIQESDEATIHLFLSESLSTYAANTEYDLGQLVVQGSNTLEAIQYQSSSAETPAESAWETLPLSQYVSAADQVLRQELFLNLSVAGVSPGDITRVVLTDVNDQAIWEQEVLIPDSHSAGTPFVVPLQFLGQKPGRYRLFVDDTEIDDFVLCDPLISQDAFALVEIALNPAVVPPAFTLLQVSDRDTLIQPRTYRIRFKNRITRWRYRSERDHGFDETNPIADAFMVLDTQTYATRRPLGLRQKPASSPLNNGKRNLPFPSAALIKPVVDSDRHIIDVFSDVYL